MGAELVSYDEIKTFFEDGWIDQVLFPVGLDQNGQNTAHAFG